MLQHQHQHDGVQEEGCTWFLVTGMSRPEADDLWSSLVLQFVSSPQPNSAQAEGRRILHTHRPLSQTLWTTQASQSRRIRTQLSWELCGSWL